MDEKLNLLRKNNLDLLHLAKTTDGRADSGGSSSAEEKNERRERRIQGEKPEEDDHRAIGAIIRSQFSKTAESALRWIESMFVG